MADPPFWISIAVLSIVQGGLVALPATWPALGRSLSRFRSGWWAIIPVASLVAVAFGLMRTAAAPQGLTYLALAAVPPLAAAALGWATRGLRPWHAVAVIPLFVAAWTRPADLGGQTAALALTGLACAALGVALVVLAPPLLIRIGVLVMAATDAVLVGAELLHAPNSALIAAHPAAQLPRLQSVIFGSAVMGFGDLFVAALVGALYAARPRVQLRAAAVIALLALVGDLAFFRISEFPATVPVAVGMVIVDIWQFRRDRALGRVTSL